MLNRLLVTSALIVFISQSATADDSDASEAPQAWMNVGIGVADVRSSEDGAYVGLGLAATRRFEWFAVTGRVSHLMSDIAFGSSATELALLGGIVLSGNAYLVVHPAIGIASVSMQDSGVSSSTSTPAFAGFAWSVAVFPAGNANISLQAFGNSGKTSSWYGGMFQLQFGW